MQIHVGIISLYGINISLSCAVHDFCQVVEGFERSIILLELDREDFSRESNKKMLGFFRSIVKQETALLFRVLFFKLYIYTPLITNVFPM